MIDDEVAIKNNLARLGPTALAQLQRILTSSTDFRSGFLRAFMARSSSPGTDALAELIAVCVGSAAAVVGVVVGQLG